MGLIAIALIVIALVFLWMWRNRGSMLAPAAACDCSCMPMSGDPNRQKIETAAGEDCNNNIYFGPGDDKGVAECQARLAEICAERGGGTTTPPAEDEEPTDGQTPSGTAPAGGCAAENCMFSVTGSHDMEEHTGTRNYASGGSSPTYEAETNGDFEKYCVIWYGNIGEPDDDSDNITIKMNGDGHSDGNCCWYSTGVTFGGDTYFGAEKEHPSDNVQHGDSESVSGQSVGSIVSKEIGIQSCFVKESASDTPSIGMWMDTGGGTWEEVLPWTKDPGGFGWGEIQSEQNILVRIDNASNLENATCAQVHEISGSAPSGGGGTPTTPSTPTTPTTPPASSGTGDEDEDEEDEDSEDEDSEDEDEDEDEGSNVGAALLRNPARCKAEFFGKCDTECRSGTSQRCTTCRNVCGTSASIARRQFRDSMQRAFSAGQFSYRAYESRRKGRPRLARFGADKEDSVFIKDVPWQGGGYGFGDYRHVRMGNVR